MPDIWFDVDTSLGEVPVNVMPLIDDTDFKTRETAVAYNAAGMDLVWNFVTSSGAFTQTAVTPTTGGSYDWAHQGDGIYTIEMPASGGASINNDTEGYGWFSGVATGVLPWRGPIIGFRAAAINDALCDGGDYLPTNTKKWNDSTAPLAALGTTGLAAIDAAQIGALTVSELSSVPGASPTFLQALALLYMALRNKETQTGGAKTIHKDSGAVLGTSNITDDGTTLTKDKLA